MSSEEKVSHPEVDWVTRVQGKEGIVRHFDTVVDLNPLLLVRLNYDSRTLELEFVSFASPIRWSPKWAKEDNGGTFLMLSGSTSRLRIAEPVFCVNTLIITADCKLTGVVNTRGVLMEHEFQGIAPKLYQNDKAIVEAECSTLRLTGISPISKVLADQYRDPSTFT